MRATFSRPVKLMSVLAVLALTAAACDFSQNAQTLTVDTAQEELAGVGGDEVVLGVLDYRTTPGTVGSTTVTSAGASVQIGGNDIQSGTTLTISNDIGRFSFSGLDLVTNTSLAAGVVPPVVGKVIVVFERDFSSDREAFMNMLESTLIQNLQASVETLAIADPSDTAVYASTVAAAMDIVSEQVESTAISAWPSYDEGPSIDDDDLIGVGFTALSLSPLAQSPVVDAAFSAALSDPNELAGVLYDVTPGTVGEGRQDAITVSGDGASYTIAISTTNDVLTPPNQAPIAADDAFTTDDDVSFVAPVLGNDNDPDGDVLDVASIDTTVTVGSVTLVGGVVTYDPAASYGGLGAGEVATDTFGYGVSDGNGGMDDATVTVTIVGVGQPFGGRFETLSLDASYATWQTVVFDQIHTNPIVACSVVYSDGVFPTSAQVRAVNATSMQVRITAAISPIAQQPPFSASETVHCFVVDEGVWSFDDGTTIEARQVSMEVPGLFPGSIDLSHTFTSPVVLGQISTENSVVDRWTTFRRDFCLSTGCSNDPVLVNGYDGTPFFGDTETVDVVVFEAGRSTISGVEFEAGLTPDTVFSVPTTRSFSTPFATAPTVGVVTQATVDGLDDSWAVAVGPATPTGFVLQIDEDQLSDTERAHTTEQVAYAYFSLQLAVIFTLA